MRFAHGAPQRTLAGNTIASSQSTDPHSPRSNEFNNQRGMRRAASLGQASTLCVTAQNASCCAPGLISWLRGALFRGATRNARQRPRQGRHSAMFKRSPLCRRTAGSESAKCYYCSRGWAPAELSIPVDGNALALDPSASTANALSSQNLGKSRGS